MWKEITGNDVEREGEDFKKDIEVRGGFNNEGEAAGFPGRAAAGRVRVREQGQSLEGKKREHGEINSSQTVRNKK